MNKKLILSALLFSTVLGTAVPYSLTAAEQPAVRDVGAQIHGIDLPAPQNNEDRPTNNIVNGITNRLSEAMSGLAAGAATAYIDLNWTLPLLISGLKEKKLGLFGCGTASLLITSLVLGPRTNTSRLFNWIGWGAYHGYNRWNLSRQLEDLRSILSVLRFSLARSLHV